MAGGLGRLSHGIRKGARRAVWQGSQNQQGLRRWCWPPPTLPLAQGAGGTPLHWDFSAQVQLRPRALGSRTPGTWGSVSCSQGECPRASPCSAERPYTQGLCPDVHLSSWASSPSAPSALWAGPSWPGLQLHSLHLILAHHLTPRGLSAVQFCSILGVLLWLQDTHLKGVAGAAALHQPSGL